MVLCRTRLENFERRIVRKNGQAGIISWHANHLQDSDGNAVGSIALGADVTGQRRKQEDRERLEEQVRQMQKMESIGRLAGGVAHDFNNLLTAIQGSAELALAQQSPEDRTHGRLLTIQKAADSAVNLTCRLLAFSRKQIIAPRILDLSELLRNLSGMLQRLIGENTQLQTLPAEVLAFINADPGQVEQIILNLAVNARDAMPEGGRLTLATSDLDLDEATSQEYPQTAPGRYVLLTVSDTGCGIPAKILDHVFEPFFTTKASGKGTGLGLAMVYGAVKQNGGSIACASIPDRGTTFRLLFPAVLEAAQAAPQTPAVAPWPEGSETILVVEENPQVLAFVEAVLVRQGYRALQATSGEAALRVAAGFPEHIHLLLTDVILPGIHGRILAERLRALRPDLKVLYASGYSGDLISNSGILEEGIDFISKPFHAQTLAQKVRAILDGSA